MSRLPSSLSLIADLPPELLQKLSLLPALSPPPGVTPNFRNPVTRSAAAIVPSSIVLGIALVFFLNRVYAKVWLMRKITWDDGTLVLGVLSSIAYYVSMLYPISKGIMSRHMWDVSILKVISNDNLVPAYIGPLVAQPAYYFLQVSFFILYLQLFGPLRWMRVCNCIGILTSTLFYMAVTLFTLIVSTPRRGETWIRRQALSITHITAIDTPTSAIRCVLDLYTMALPICAIAQMRLPLKRKLGAMLIFLCGSLEIGCSILALVSRHRTMKKGELADMTWDFPVTQVIAIAEFSIGIICVCVPSMAYSLRHERSIYSSPRKWLSSLSRREESDPVFSSTHRVKKDPYPVETTADEKDAPQSKFKLHLSLLTRHTITFGSVLAKHESYA